MRTKESRGRMAKIERKTKRFPSDLTDEEWAAMEPLMPSVARTGRRRSIDLREILNAIRYMVRSGITFHSGRRSTGGPVALCGSCCFAPSMMWL